MRAGECLKRIRPLVRERLPGDLRDFRWEASFLAKLWYGNHALHYEVTPRPRAGVIEIGLHFESDPLTNARLLAAFRAHAITLRRRLPGARIERWDRGWCRVWEALPYRTPDLELARELAARIAGYVTALETILRRELPSDVEWSMPVPRPRIGRPATLGDDGARTGKARAREPSRGSRAAR